MVSTNQQKKMVMTTNMMIMVIVLATVGVEGTCTWLRKQPGSKSMFQVFSNHTIAMLQRMGNNSYQGELSDFPDRQYSHASHLTADEKLGFLADTLDEVERVFNSGSHKSTNWQQSRVDTFSNDLFRQTSELEHCVEEMKISPSHSVTKLTKRTKLHFRALKKSLKDKGYSASCWDDVRAVLLMHLLRLDLLATSITQTSQ